MNEKLRQQYDSLYSSKGNIFGKGQPIEVLQRLGDYIQTGTVLDIGGGEGRNALYLAKQGFEVWVYDLSEVGLEKIQLAAKTNNLNIHTRVTDITTQDIEGTYDLMLLSFVLHHMNTTDVEQLIRQVQQHTKTAGIHVVSTFMNQGGLSDRNENSGRFYPSETELRDLYAGWKILELSTHETSTLARNKAGAPMKNLVVTLVAAHD